jgi:hypothetical protein
MSLPVKTIRRFRILSDLGAVEFCTSESSFLVASPLASAASPARALRDTSFTSALIGLTNGASDTVDPVRRENWILPSHCIPCPFPPNRGSIRQKVQVARCKRRRSEVTASRSSETLRFYRSLSARNAQRYTSRRLTVGGRVIGSMIPSPNEMQNRNRPSRRERDGRRHRRPPPLPGEGGGGEGQAAIRPSCGEISVISRGRRREVAALTGPAARNNQL